MTPKRQSNAGNVVSVNPDTIDMELRDKEDRNQVTRYAIAQQSDAELDALAKVFGRMEVLLPDQEAQLWDLVIDRFNRTAITMAQAGFVLLKLKTMLGHGNFLAGLEARDIKERTARIAMAAAKFLMTMPESARQKLAPLSGKKLIELSRLPEDALEELAAREVFDGKPIDELKRMSERELREKVQKECERLAHKEADLKAENDRQRAEIAELNLRITDLEGNQSTPDEAEAAELRRLQDVANTVWKALWTIKADNMQDASAAVKILARQIAEYISAHGYFIENDLRNRYPECWPDQDPPSAEQMDDATDRLVRTSGQMKTARADRLN